MLLFLFLKSFSWISTRGPRAPQKFWTCLSFSPDSTLKKPLPINYGLSTKLTEGVSAFKIAQLSLKSSNRCSLSWHVEILSHSFPGTESAWSPWDSFSLHLDFNVLNKDVITFSHAPSRTNPFEVKEEVLTVVTVQQALRSADIHMVKCLIRVLNWSGWEKKPFDFSKKETSSNSNIHWVLEFWPFISSMS